MLTFYAVFFLFSLKLGVQSEVSLKLNISSESADVFTKNYVEFDSVSYVIYKPVADGDIEEVLDGDVVVWNGSNTYDKAKSIVVAYDDNSPSLLYVYTPLYTYYKYYYVRVEDKWVDSSYDWYSYRLELIKSKTSEDFIMDLGFNESTNRFVYSPPTTSKQYATFIPLNGYSATSVNYNLSSLWTAKNPGEKVVVGWSYNYYNTHYLIRLLVSDVNDRFQFYNYIRLKNHWVDMNSTPLAVKSSYKYPEDLYFPKYLAMRMDNKPYVFDSTFTEATKTKEVTSSNYDFTYHNKPIPVEKCLKLDFSKRVSDKVALTLTSILDGKLHVLSYFPVPGTYFSVVTDATDTIYQRNIDVEACVGVHFYKRADKEYLADVLVTGPRNSRSEYHVKQEDKWHPINKGRFFTLMEELRNQ